MFISHYFYLPQKDRIVILLIKSCDPANKKKTDSPRGRQSLYNCRYACLTSSPSTQPQHLHRPS